MNILLKKYGKNRYRKNPIAGIGQDLQQPSEKSDTESTSRGTNKETTTQSGSSTAKKSTKATPQDGCGRFSFVLEGDDDREIEDKAADLFGAAAGPMVKAYLESGGREYVKDAIDSATEYMREELSKGRPVKPLRILKKALEKKWQVSQTVKPSPKKTQAQQPTFEPELPSLERRRELLAETKATISAAQR